MAERMAEARCKPAGTQGFAVIVLLLLPHWHSGRAEGGGRGQKGGGRGGKQTTPGLGTGGN